MDARTDGSTGWLDPSRWSDRDGLVLVIVGTVLAGPIMVLAPILVAWFVSTFSDGCGDRFLGCISGLWPVWVVALLIAIAAAAILVGMALGRRVALVLGGSSGLALALVGIWQLAAGGHEPARALLLLAGLVGGAALAAGAATRLDRRGQARTPQPPGNVSLTDRP